jgi:signal transduction histidine kinase
MTEVSPKVTGVWLRYLQQRRPELAIDELLAGLSVPPETFLSGSRRVPWNDFVVMCERFENAIGGPGEWRTVLREMRGSHVMDSEPWLRYFVSADLAYQAAFRTRKLLWPFHDHTLERMPDGRLFFEVRIPKSYASSAAFLRATEAAVRALPLILGQPESEAESEVDERSLRMWITPPTQSRIWKVFDLMRLWIATPRAMRTYGLESRELRDRYDELAAAHGRIEDQAASLRKEVAERERAEAERLEATATLRQQQKLDAIGLLASGVAHEVNNPIHGIMNYACLLQKILEPGTAGHEYAQEILAESKRVSHIVRDLLVFSRRDRDPPFDCNPGDIIHGTLALVRAVLAEDHIVLRVELSPGLPDLRCREQQIRQVLMNLVTNARDALNARFPEANDDKVIAISACVLERSGCNWIRFTVADRGAGISAPDRERIFEPFFTTKGPNQGTGLGLFVTHGIVRDHGGVIEVESEPGRTRFHVDIPVGQLEEPHLPNLVLPQLSSNGSWATR